ncbi:TPA: hypothetical protein ACH3X1_006814 [Trebouxia sp. C0004]
MSQTGLLGNLHGVQTRSSYNQSCTCLQRRSLRLHRLPQASRPTRVARGNYSMSAGQRVRHVTASSATASPPAPSAAAPEQQQAAPVLPFRVGYGFDLHRLVEGKKLIICGIDVPHVRGCDAHSDGDVALHALTDAILGALCLPDIGQLFPDTDPKWKGANSDTFIKEAVRLMHERGYQLGNVDITIIAQQPKLSPHKEKMRDQLCLLLGSHPSTVNIKAKTHEKVDSLGENRSIACHTVCTLLRS